MHGTPKFWCILNLFQNIKSPTYLADCKDYVYFSPRLKKTIPLTNQIVATDPSLIMEDVSKPRRGSSTCAWVNIIYGCNEHCTYCVVPGVRGVEQSRPKESIRQEMVELAAAGYREVMNDDIQTLLQDTYTAAACKL